MTINNQDTIANPFKFKLKNIIFLVLVLVGFYLLLPQLAGVQKALLLLLTVNKYYLILALMAEVISYIGAASLLGIIFSRLGHKIAFLTRFKLGSISAFTIHFLPLGVAGEAAFEYYFLKKIKIDSGLILIMWVLRWIFNYMGFIIIFLFGLIMVPIYSHLSLGPKVAASVILILVLLGVLYLVNLYRHKEKFWKIWIKVFNFINKMLVRFKKNSVSVEKYTEIFEDIYQGLELFGQKKRNSIFAILSGIVYWLGDITCLYFVFRSFGYTINWGSLIFGYCSSTLLAIVSAVPGGIGVTEGSMTLIFSSVGVPAALALTVVLVFRLFSFWIWMPIGLLSFLSLQKTKEIKD